MSDDSFDGRALLKGGLNAAMMASFTYHTEGVHFGPGQKLGAVIAVGIAVMDAFFPNQAPVDPDPVATKKEVETALNGLVKGVIDQEWWDKVSDIQNKILAMTQGFYDVWDDLKNNMQLQPDGTLKVNGVDVPLKRDQTTSPLASKYAYLNPMDRAQILHGLRKARYTLETSSLNDASLTSLQVAQHQTLTIGLYALIGALTATYLQACIAFAWARERQLSWRYQLFQEELKAAQGDNTKVLQVEAKYEDVNTSTGYQPLGWNDFVKTPGLYVSILTSEVQAMLDYCIGVPATDTQPAKDGLYTSMFKDLADFDSKIASYDVVPVQPTAVTKAEMTLAVENGAIRSGQWATLDAQNARLQNVPEDDLALFHKNIETWKGIAATVQFEVYRVPKGGAYIDDIAQTYYGDWSKYYLNLISANNDILDYDKLFPAPPQPTRFQQNPPQAPRGGFLAEGTLLRMFTLDALPYILNPPQAA